MILYRLVTSVLALATLLRLAFARLWGGAGVRPPWAERVLPPSRHRADTTGPVIWMHGSSNGELTSARPLVTALLARYPDGRFLVTSNSITGRAMAEGWQLPRTKVQLAPIDSRGLTRRFLDAVRPDLLLVIENELWPNRLAECARRGVPVLIVGARLSARSARRWGRFPRLIRRIMATLSWVSPQDEGTRDRLVALGLDPSRLGPTMSLKAIATGTRASTARPAPSPLRAQTLFAASTHEGEEALLLDAFMLLRAEHPDTGLILAPRHPRRRDEIEALLRARALPFATRSRGEEMPADRPVYLADTMGEMGRWYDAAAMTFVGGSLVDRGGHTPYEPAAHRSAILHGPFVANFADTYGRLDGAGAAIRIESPAALAAAAGALIARPEKAADMAARALRLCEEGRDASALDPVLEAAGRAIGAR